MQRLLFGSPYGSRTRVSWLRTMHPRPLDEGAKISITRSVYITNTPEYQRKSLLYDFFREGLFFLIKEIFSALVNLLI